MDRQKAIGEIEEISKNAMYFLTAKEKAIKGREQSIADFENHVLIQKSMYKTTIIPNKILSIKSNIIFPVIGIIFLGNLLIILNFPYHILMKNIFLKLINLFLMILNYIMILIHVYIILYFLLKMILQNLM